MAEIDEPVERRAFEEWARKPTRYRAPLNLDRYPKVNSPWAGEYKHNDTDLAWNAWLASVRRKREEVCGG